MYFCVSLKTLAKIRKNISKIFSRKYSQTLIDHTKKSPTEGIKIASNKVLQKTAETTGNLIVNKIADEITKVSESSPKNNLQIAESET